MIFRQATRDEILPLRAEVLRPGQSKEKAIFPEDTHAECFHFGAFSDKGCVACLTLVFVPWENQPAWQPRGMAVHQEFQGKAIGKTLLELAVDFAQKRATATLMWCNAREKAIPFYEKNGWTASGALFEIPVIGTHVKMWRRI